MVENHGFPLTKLMVVNTGLARLHRLRYGDAVGRNEKHHYAKFFENWSIQSRDVAML